ncbi:MAG: deoxyribonuclease IV [Bacillota bacterium]
MRLGIHMPLKGGFAQNIKRVKEIGCDAVQIFPGNPTGWKMGVADPLEMEKRLISLHEQSIHPLVVHSAYLINLAATSDDFYEKSRQLLKATMERAALYRSPYVVLHTGNHGGLGVGQGLARIIETISSERSGWPVSVKLLLENTAGSGTALGSRLEELAEIMHAFPRGALGVCFDTAHAWGAGYDLGSASATELLLEQFEKLIGLDHLCVLHLNDSKAACGSRVDRHDHIGLGAIGPECFRTLLRQPWPADLPAILETPEIGSEWDRKNMETLHSLLE